MNVNHAAVLQQNLNLTITPKLIQSMHILQLSSADLVSYLHEQSSENPLLEVSWTENKSRRSKVKQAANNGNMAFVELTANEPDTLEMVLISQLRLTELNNRSYNIAKFLAGSLNESGLLDISLEEAAYCLQVEVTEVAVALEALQALEPAGVAARTLQECLLIQLQRAEKADRLAEVLISNHIHELGSGKWKHLAQVLNVSLEQVKQSLAFIRTLNPRPGLPYRHERQVDLKPDATIQKKSDEYVIMLHEDGMPKVSLNTQVQKLCAESDCKETGDYARKRIQTATWLIQSLDQRRQTLYRVIEAITEEQQLFLDKGLSYLKPMNLKTIADKLELHQSTISRAIQNKVVQTPHGMFELKFFFATGLITADGEAASAERIKCRIRELVDAENKSKPLSDQLLTDTLTREGLQISRRTVMKYREEMQILSSRLRGAESVN
ncbi:MULTISPECIES: RNA polymerase factor sigma-54 [unclassified Paenibacillus]|uniref:RNA polymerase factor sigma-54 n=1 Tax=unclassified Paenibacillus TaxID=185978 RepID=UPI003643948E